MPKDFLGTSGDDTHVGPERLMVGGRGADWLQAGGVQDSELRGGSGADRLAGNFNTANDDLLLGERGDDILAGWDGNDILKGGRGKDTFIFFIDGSHDGVDRVLDFTPSKDVLWINDGIVTGATAHYDSASGDLLYDKDGAGGQTAVSIAHLKTGLVIADGDILIYA